MSITMMGTIGSYTKTMKLQTQWDLKKQSGDLTSHKKSLDEWLQSNTANTSSAGTSSTDKIGNGDSKLRTIQAKVDAGKKLTEQERAYLKEKDPETYADLEAEEQEQRAYEQKLKRCRTKEEVQRLKMSHVGTSLTKVNAVKNDPNISLEKKLKIAKQELRRCNRVEESTREFVRQGEYEKLPTDQELAQAEREEARRDVPEAEDAGNTEPAAQDKKTSDAADSESTERDAKTSDAADTKPEAPARTRAEKTEAAAGTRAKKADVRVDSPELRKARRAKAKAAYAYIQQRDVQDASVPSLDQKA